MPVRTDELARSEEMSDFYRTLAAVQRNAIFHVMSGKNAAQMKEFAKTETKLLQEFMCGKGEKCPDGQIWNPVTRQCE